MKITPPRRWGNCRFHRVNVIVFVGQGAGVGVLKCFCPLWHFVF